MLPQSPTAPAQEPRKRRGVPLAWRLMLAIVATVVVVLALGLALIARRDIASLRTDLVHGTLRTARLVAAYTAVDLDFGVREDAERSLQHLAADPELETARLYDATGMPFATWRRSPGPVSGPSALAVTELGPHGEQHLAGGHVDVLLPVMAGDRRVGALFLRASTAALDDRIEDYLMTLAALAAVLVVLAVAVAALLQRGVSRPILRLAAAAERVSATGDYTLRIDVHGAPEVTALEDSINHMLEAVAQRERERDAAELARQRTEDMLLQSQKLEAVGRLTAGIAHDFNNLLTPILSCTELASEGLCERCAAETRPLLDEVLDASRRSADLTRQLLAFSRQQIMEPRVVELAGIVTAMQTMLRRTLGEDIELTFACAEDTGRCRVDPSQVQQILLNLAVNARDAMPHGGKLLIETRRVDLDEEAFASYGVPAAGRYVQLSVTDTGTGMDKATLARIFEPFFTTKARGRGTGLGLATVYGIVRQLGGAIRVYSEPGHGSVFHVYLPSTEQPVEPPPPPVAAASLAGTETVLLVEDDDLVRAVAADILTRHGYKVVAAVGGEAALARLPELGKVDLLLTDVVMRGMDGRQVAEKVVALRPDIKVLYMSGYTQDAIVRHGVLEENIAFLHKPITPTALLVKVRQVLDAPGEPSAAEK